jgi:hypothetical protein
MLFRTEWCGYSVFRSPSLLFLNAGLFLQHNILFVGNCFHFYWMSTRSLSSRCTPYFFYLPFYGLLICIEKKIPPPIVCIHLLDSPWILYLGEKYFLFLETRGIFCCHCPAAVFSTNGIKIVFNFYCRCDTTFYANQAWDFYNDCLQVIFLACSFPVRKFCRYVCACPSVTRVDITRGPVERTVSVPSEFL